MSLLIRIMDFNWLIFLSSAYLQQNFNVYEFTIGGGAVALDAQLIKVKRRVKSNHTLNNLLECRQCIDLLESLPSDESA